MHQSEVKNEAKNSVFSSEECGKIHGIHVASHVLGFEMNLLRLHFFDHGVPVHCQQHAAHELLRMTSLGFSKSAASTAAMASPLTIQQFGQVAI